MSAETELWDGLPRNGYRFERRSFGWGTSFPSTWRPGANFYNLTTEELVRNTGTRTTPIWQTVSSTEEAAIAVIMALGE